MTTAANERISAIKAMVSNIADVETFLRGKGRLVGGMVHVNIGDLAAAIQAASQSKDAGGWQKIESAPRDGTRVLLWWTTCRDVHAGKYTYDEDSPYQKEGFRCDGDECIPRNQQDCIKWQPLPAAPKADAGEV